MYRKGLIVLCILFAASAEAQQKTAEELVASKKKADITYRQLMEIMGSASGLINEGIVRENPQMVRNGATLILDHPAPNHKPWTIVAEPERAAFKQTLLTFDKIMDNQAEKAAQLAEKRDWSGAGKAAYELTNSCISCHAAWKQKAR